MWSAAHFAAAPRWRPADLDAFSQNPADYAGAAPAPLAVAALPQTYRAQFFAPWGAAVPPDAPDYSGLAAMHDGRGRLYPQQVIESIVLNMALGSYPNAAADAVAVRESPLRALPTDLPFYEAPRGPSFGEPFDNLQVSVLHANSPVKILHTTADGEWALALHAGGKRLWTPRAGLALAGASLRAQFRSARLMAVALDLPALGARIGGVLPIIGGRTMTAEADSRGRAAWRRSDLPARALAAWPMVPGGANLGRLAAAMAGRYGWGGRSGDRDCSLLLQDFFAAFGVWLPRHSAAQAAAFEAIDLASLAPADKEARVLADGVPWRTLLYLPGHIMLYVGEKDGRALVWHNIWGVRRTDLFGRDGRIRVDGTVVSTLTLGQELPGATGSLLSRLTKMAVIRAKPANY
ncbi:hydrolase Nlp/P60 [Alphaproteobacteria bacterium]|nr:hydrolase Nlp/P60 [Alphaproteobacteria bacterium]